MKKIYSQQMIFQVDAQPPSNQSVYKIHEDCEVDAGNNPENSSVKGIYAFFCLLCSLIFYINPVIAKPETMNMTGVQYQGVITMLDPEAGQIDINQKPFALATPLRVTTADKTIVNTSVLASGQLVEFWLDGQAAKQNTELPYATIHQLRIISDVNPQTITH